MSNLRALIHQLEAYAQEELDLQSRTLVVLREQEAALFNGDLEAMRRDMQRLDKELVGAASRSGRRSDLLRRLGLEFGVAPKTLTLTSICTRLGRDGERLTRIAGELREATQSVSRATRRLGALGRMHAKLNDEILGTVLADSGVDRNNMERCGALLDARV